MLLSDSSLQKLRLVTVVNGVSAIWIYFLEVLEQD